jgi:cytochrome c oxidase assembly protein subunit 15
MRIPFDWRTLDWRMVVKRLSLVATIGMFLVLVMGTVVTNTGSAEGCGHTWPLCRGKLIPEFAVSTAIEYSHRSVTGIEGLLIVALAVGALAFWRKRREIQILVPLMLAFLVIQALLGGLAVMYPESPEILALHFGISLIAFVTVLLVSTTIYEAGGADAVRDRPLPRGMALSVWGLIVFTYVVVYLGAYVRHKNVGLACPDWPLCQGSVLPQLVGATGAARAVVLLHRYAAFILTIATVALTWWTSRYRRGRPDLYRGSRYALVTVLLQAAAGAWVVFSQLSLFSALSHAALVALYFGALSYLCVHVLPRPAAFRAKLVRVPQRPVAAPTPPAPAPAVGTLEPGASSSVRVVANLTSPDEP